jgi:cytochrome c-type biogenesis protein CcmF
VAEVQARPGQTFAVGDYVLRHEGVQRRQAANATETRATLAVSRDGRDLGEIHPGKNRYPVENQVSNEVAIRSDLLTGEDLFVIADQVDADGTVYFKVFVKPLVNLVWLAGLVFIIGALVTMWPDAREARRLALRYEGEGAVGVRA